MVRRAYNSSFNRGRGVAVVEFLFAAPAFFILVFFVVEIALVWTDRHIMRLAAYRAAKTVVKMRSEYPGPKLCWGDDPGPNDPGRIILKASRRSASKVMATVTPSITQLMTMFGNPLDGKNIEDLLGFEVNQAFGDGASGADVLGRVGENPYVHAIFRMMKGLPAAWVFTELECKDIKYPAADGIKQNDGVEIKLKYHRSAKMPYIGTLMWFLMRMQAYYADRGWAYDGVSEIIRVNPLNYGLEFEFSVDSATYQLAKEQMLSDLRDMVVEKAKNVSDKIKEARDRDQFGVPRPVDPSSRSRDFDGDKMGEIFDSIIAPKLNDKIDELMTKAQGTINQIGEKALELFLMAPEELKTIPISVSVRIPNYSQTFVNEGSAWNGQSVLIGRFANGENMTAMAKGMGETIDSRSPPNGPQGGVPYIDKNTGGPRE